MTFNFAHAQHTVQADLVHALVWHTFAFLTKQRRIDAKGLLNARANELRLYIDPTRSARRFLNVYKPETYVPIVAGQLQSIIKAIESKQPKTDFNLIEENEASFFKECGTLLIEFSSLQAFKTGLETIANHSNHILKLSGYSTYHLFVKFAAHLWGDLTREIERHTQLTRELHFSPDSQQAAIGILSYFSVILRQKLPAIDAAVSIRQLEDRVILTITYPDGTMEQISQLLSMYGLVVIGEKSVESLLEDPHHAIALKHKLELANLELRQVRELLSTERVVTSARLNNLSDDVQFLRKQLASALVDSTFTKQRLLKLAEANVTSNTAREESMRSLVDALISAVVEKDSKKFEDARLQLAVQDPNLLDRLHNFITSSAIGGIIGNSLYDWIKVVWPILPK